VAVAAALVAMILAAGAWAATHVTGTPNVVFEATGPVGLHITGTTHELTVAADASTVTVRVSLRRLQTGISLRDSDMRDALDVHHFPTAELTVQRSAVPLPASGSATGHARGTLRLHGQAHELPFTYSARRNGSAIEVTGTMPLRMTRFGITPPNHLGIAVRPDVVVHVRFSVLEY
jgi:polyisoprenoid-binding protein YceI